MNGSLFFLIPICASLNRARGSKFANILTSTVESRLISTALIATYVTAFAGDWRVFPAIFAGLMFWCSFAWDSYWGAAIGDGPKSRLWGVFHMGIRGLYIYPTFSTLALLGHPAAYWVGFFGALQGIPYLLAGIPKNKAYSVPLAEYTWGACLGVMFFMVLL